jgi:hypothetical protein
VFFIIAADSGSVDCRGECVASLFLLSRTIFVIEQVAIQERRNERAGGVVPISTRTALREEAAVFRKVIVFVP